MYKDTLMGAGDLGLSSNQVQVVCDPAARIPMHVASQPEDRLSILSAGFPMVQPPALGRIGGDDTVRPSTGILYTAAQFYPRLYAALLPAPSVPRNRLCKNP